MSYEEQLQAEKQMQAEEQLQAEKKMHPHQQQNSQMKSWRKRMTKFLNKGQAMEVKKTVLIDREPVGEIEAENGAIAASSTSTHRPNSVFYANSNRLSAKEIEKIRFTGNSLKLNPNQVYIDRGVYQGASCRTVNGVNCKWS